MRKLRAVTLDRRIVIERPVAAKGFRGAGSGTWERVDEVYANIQDALPSRSERLGDGINAAARPSRIRIRFRTDVTPDMRFVAGDRVMQIVSGPAEMGRREALEFMVEEYRPAGNPA